MSGKKHSILKPDLFSQSPMLSLLPSLGDVKQLEAMKPFFFARYERTKAILASIKDQGGTHALSLELAMLRDILDWLGVNLSSE